MYSNTEKKKDSSKIKKLLFLIAVVWTMSLFAGTQNIPKNVITDEEAQLLQDHATALKNSVSSSKEELEKINKRWVYIKDNYGNHKNPRVLKLINYLNAHGLSKNLTGAIGTLDKMESSIKNLSKTKAGYDEAKKFYDRYKPDKNNPMRSLEQISHALEDLDKMIEKMDPTGGTLTKPIREIITFYSQAATAYAGALKRVGRKIKERGGKVIGEGCTNGVDNVTKSRTFIKNFPGAIIFPYPSLKYKEAEFWSDEQRRLFFWDGDDWTEMTCGIDGSIFIYKGMRLAHKSRPMFDIFVSRCNTSYDKVQAAKQRAKEYYKVLFSKNSCVKSILKYKNVLLKHFSQEEFVARYTFRQESRRTIDSIIDTLERSIYVEGRVVDEKKRGLSKVHLKINAEGMEWNIKTSKGGWFVTLLPIEQIPNDRLNAKVTIKKDKGKSYKSVWPLHHRCNRWYSITLREPEEDIVVPELTGLTKALAIKYLKKSKLIFVPEELPSPSPSAKTGIVISQKPSPGTMVKEQSKVAVRFYAPAVKPVSNNNDADTPDVPPVISGTDTPTDTDVDTDDDTKENQYSGGLVISGPSSLRVGDGVSYVAVDGAGNPYSAGSFQWHNTREDIMSLGKSGKSVSGVGFKPGKTLIILHYNGMTAYLDVTIKAKKDKHNLFSVAAVEEVGGEQCNNSLARSRAAYSAGDYDRARAIAMQGDNCSWKTDMLAMINRAQEQSKCQKISTALNIAINNKNYSNIKRYRTLAGEYRCRIDAVIWQESTLVLEERQRENERAQQQHQVVANQNRSNTRTTTQQGEAALVSFLNMTQNFLRETQRQQQNNTRSTPTRSRNQTVTPTPSRTQYRGNTCPKQNPGTRGSYRFDNNNNPNDNTYIACSYFPDGALRVQTPIKRGKKDGLQITYGSNFSGKKHPLATEITYRNGVKNGQAKYYTWCKKNGRIIRYLGSTVYYNNGRKGHTEHRRSPCH